MGSKSQNEDRERKETHSCETSHLFSVPYSFIWPVFFFVLFRIRIALANLVGTLDQTYYISRYSPPTKVFNVPSPSEDFQQNKKSPTLNARGSSSSAYMSITPWTMHIALPGSCTLYTQCVWPLSSCSCSIQIPPWLPLFPSAGSQDLRVAQNGQHSTRLMLLCMGLLSAQGLNLNSHIGNDLLTTD